MDLDQLDDDTRRKVEDLLCGGLKIAAIKEIRTATGLGLKDAKDLAESIEHRLSGEGRISQQTSAAKKSGCAGLLLLAAVIPTALLTLSLLL